MSRTRARFTIGRLMVAIAVVAVWLALDVGLGVLVSTFVVALVPGAGYLAWRATRRRRRAAAWGFALSAALASIGAAVICVFPAGRRHFVLLLPFIAAAPVVALILGFGISWAVQATRRDASPRRSPGVAWLSVAVLAILPLSMMFTMWPLRLAFLASRPALNRLADRISAGEELSQPEYAGLYRVIATRQDLVNGSVALIVHDDRGGDSGFVRLAPGQTRGGRGYVESMNVFVDLDLDGTWALYGAEMTSVLDRILQMIFPTRPVVRTSIDRNDRFMLAADHASPNGLG